MRTDIKKELDNLQLSDVYALMLFVLYKVQEIPEYETLSELCYLLDSRSLTRMLTFFAGKTITIPTEQEFKILSNALLLYNKINLEGKSYVKAMSELKDLSEEEKAEVTNLYAQIVPIMSKYSVSKRGMTDER